MMTIALENKLKRRRDESFQKKEDEFVSAVCVEKHWLRGHVFSTNIVMFCLPGPDQEATISITKTVPGYTAAASTDFGRAWSKDFVSQNQGVRVSPLPILIPHTSSISPRSLEHKRTITSVSLAEERQILKEIDIVKKSKTQLEEYHAILKRVEDTKVRKMTVCEIRDSAYSKNPR